MTRSIIRKVATVALGFAMAAMMAPGSLAWFTDREEIENQINMGAVEIGVTEFSDECGTPWETVECAVPGDEYDKYIKVCNLACADAWIRVKFDICLDKLDETDKAAVIDLLALDPNVLGSDAELFAEPKGEVLPESWFPGIWIKWGNYYYFSKPVPSGTCTTLLHNDLKLPTSWGNEYEGALIKWTVTIEAVQSDNNGWYFGAAQGWPMSP